MGLNLKERKLINNGGLPKFNDGLSLADLYGGWGNQTPITYTPFKQPINIQIPYENRPSGVSIIPDAQKSILLEQQAMLNKKLDFTPIKDVGGTTEPTKEDRIGNIGGIIQSGIGFAGSMINAANDFKTKNKFLADAGTSTGSVGGISYNRINQIYKNGKMPKFYEGTGTHALNGAGTGAAFGASIGSLFPGAGTIIGGAAGALIGGIGGALFGESARREEERQKNLAREYRTDYNNFQFDNAFSKVLQLNEGQQGYAEGKQPTYSAFGKVNAKPDSYVSKNEVAMKLNPFGEIESMFRIPTGPNDTAKFVGGKDPNVAIISNKYGLSDLASVDPYAALELLSEYKNAGLLKETKMEAKNGKMPKRYNGWLPNAITSGIGGLIGLNQFLSAKRLDVKRPNTYVANPYETYALNGLSKLKYNPYPIMNQINNQRAAVDYALNNSGGLSAQQKYLGRIANANNLYRTTADLMTNHQEKNIGLKSNLYSTMLNAGDSAARSRMAANQYDLDYFSKAHAQRLGGMQTGLANMLANLQNYYANDFKWRQFNDMYNLYSQDISRG